jgi:hypothetical protein
MTPLPPTAEVEIFNPTVAELNKIVGTAKDLVITDYKDKAQVEIVSAKRKELKKIRVAITNKGKELREEALAHQRKVLEKEKELVGIIIPEEERLQKLEDEVAMQIEKDRRIGLLPDKLAMLKALSFEPTPEQQQNLLLLTDEGWAEYYNRAVARKNEADRLALEAREAEQKRKEQELEDEKNRLAKEEADRIAKAEQEEKDRVAREQQAERERLQKIEDDKKKAVADAQAKERQEKEAKEREEKARADERARIEREEKDRKAKEEAERIALEKKKIYQKFLAENGYTEETKDQFIVKNDNLVITLYKKVNTLDLS